MDLDSHANMAVVERHAYILSDTGRTAEVNPFMPDYKLMQVPIINAAVQYECPYSGTLHVLVIRNALHVPSVRHNLVPPFMIREEGIQVNDTPKIWVNDPTTSDHSIYFPRNKLPHSLVVVGCVLVLSIIETDGTNIAGDRGGLPPDAESLEPSL